MQILKKKKNNESERDSLIEEKICLRFDYLKG